MAAHAAHPSVAVFAAVHAAPVAPPVEKAPGGHAPALGFEVLVRPAAAQKRPGVHGAHVDCPAAPLKVPTGQRPAAHAAVAHVAHPSVSV